MSVRELPDDFVWSSNKLLKEKCNLLPDNIGEQLKNFEDEFLNNLNNIWMGYTESGFILVNCGVKQAWTLELHELFCKKFNLILYASDCTDSYSPADHELEINYLYITKPAKEYIPLISIPYKEW